MISLYKVDEGLLDNKHGLLTWLRENRLNFHKNFYNYDLERNNPELRIYLTEVFAKLELITFNYKFFLTRYDIFLPLYDYTNSIMHISEYSFTKRGTKHIRITLSCHETDNPLIKLTFRKADILKYKRIKWTMKEIQPILNQIFHSSIRNHIFGKGLPPIPVPEINNNV